MSLNIFLLLKNFEDFYLIALGYSISYYLPRFVFVKVIASNLESSKILCKAVSGGQ